MRYIQPPWENYFFSKVQATEKSLFISSPYIKYPVASLLCKILESKHDPGLSVQLLTRIRISDLIDGASDLEAFEKLFQLAEVHGQNVAVKCLSNLHAKVYIFDENSAIVTSSNLTPSGLKSNIEYGIEVTERGTIQNILDDMNTYWHAAEPLTAVMIKQVGNRLKTTESLVSVHQTLNQIKTHSQASNSQVPLPFIGRRVAPRGQDIECAELDNLRGEISAASKYRKRARVIVTRADATIDDEAYIDSDHINQEADENIIEIESSYSELEEDSVEWLISELESNDRQRRKRALIRLKVLFALDTSCIVPYIAELAIINLGLCRMFLSQLQDSILKDSVFEILKNFIHGAKLEGKSSTALYIALGEVGSTKSKDYLRNAYTQAEKRKTSFQTRLSILKGFIAAGITPSDEQMFVQLSTSHHAKFRAISVKALCQLGESSWQKLCDMAVSDPDSDVRNQAVKSLVKIHPANAHEVLIKLREHDSDNGIKDTISSLIRRYSVRALRQIGESSWQELCDVAESDPDADVRIQAVKALVNIHSDNAHEVLVDLLKKEPESRVKDTISSLIKKHGDSNQALPVPDKPLFQTIESALQSSDRKLRRKAVKDLGKLEHSSAVELLCYSLRDVDNIVRAVAAETLGAMGNNKALFPLIKVLENDPFDNVRAAAAKALGRLGDKRALVALYKGLNDNNGSAKKWCVHSINGLV